MTHDTWQSNCGHFRRNLTCAIVHHVSRHVSMITLRHWLIFLCPLIFYVHLMLTCHQCSAKMTQISVMRSVVEFGPLFCLLKAVGRDTGVYIVVVLVGRESFVLIWLYCWRLRFVCLKWLLQTLMVVLYGKKGIEGFIWAVHLQGLGRWFGIYSTSP